MPHSKDPVSEDGLSDTIIEFLILHYSGRQPSRLNIQTYKSPDQYNSFREYNQPFHSLPYIYHTVVDTVD